MKSCEQSYTLPGPSVLPIDLDPFVDDPAEFAIDLRLVASVAAGIDPTGNGSDVTLVFFGPNDELEVVIAGFHFFDSSIFALTNLS
jgi:hypothetical protein